MDATKLPHPYQAALAAFNGLRCLGFPSEHIFFTYNPGRGMFVTVDHDGQKWGIRCGGLDLSYEGWEKDWSKVITAMLDRSLTQESLDQVWDNFAPQRYKLVEDLTLSGVRIPNVERDKARRGL